MAIAQAIFEECWPQWQQHFFPETRLRLGGVPLETLADDADLRLSDLASHYLSADELEQWSRYSLKKRRLEWLGGRLSAKSAAAGLISETALDWRTLEIRSEEDGRPYLTTATAVVTPFFSISHSGPMAAALAANTPCGLDIQQQVAKIHTLKERFAFPEEADILTAALPPKSCTETQQLTLLWAAKEAIRKMVRVRPLLGLLEIRLLTAQGGSAAPHDPLVLTFTSGRGQVCPSPITVLCFFADTLAWAVACLPITTKE